MSAAKAARAATLSRVFAWAGLVLAIVAACSSAGPVDAPDGATADAAVQPLTEAECIAKNSECAKATWTNLGTCSIEPKPGNACGAGDAVCSGICSAEGTCVGPGPELHCGSPASPCSLCDGNGSCGINTSGAQCTPISMAGGCFEQAGTCDATGKCKLGSVNGKACVANPGPCGAGICDATGFCRPATEGQPCKGASGTCRKYQGTCDADGACVGAADTGAKCSTSTKQDCRKSTGVCRPNGECEGDIDEGAACASGTGACGAICTADGTCVAVSPGTPCASTGTDCPKFCTQAGSCAVNVGSDCTVKVGACAGKPGVCSSTGSCLPAGECAKPAVTVPCGDFAKGLTCDKKSVATSGGTCWSPPAMPPANSGTCGDDGDPCSPKFCKTLDSDETFTCKVGQLNDGTPCPGEAGNPCAASTCLAGKCTQAFKPAGTSCKPLAPAVCAEFQCSSAGKCEPIPASVPLAAPCTVSDGDTDCWAKSCDGQGNCTKVPRAKGEHCGAELDNGCAKFACDGKGRCLVDLVAVNGECKDAKCLDFYAKPGTPCTGGPCTDNGCTSLGICATSYKPVGAPCELFGYAGTCDESHVCVWPTKVMGAIAGSSCYGTFPCMKEDVAYGADGICHGTVAVGAACGSVCNPGICGADGTCQQAFAAKGVACGATSSCGALHCDGKGGCGLPAEDLGKTCGSAYATDCEKYGCNAQGQCVLLPLPGKVCSPGIPCHSGMCSADGKCIATKLTGTGCALSSNDECQKGLCGNGICTAVAIPGKACGKDTECLSYSCNVSGECAAKPKTGASCVSTEMCKVGVCDALGECKQVLAPGAKCVGKQQCMEGTCNASGGCEFAPMPSGSQCTAVAPGNDWGCYTGACDGKGGCILKVNTGAACTTWDQAVCTTGVCQSDASCKAVLVSPGQPCTTSCIPKGTCGSGGQCEGNALVDSPCGATCISGGKCNKDGKCLGTVAAGAACGPYFNPDGRCVAAACKSDGTCVPDVYAPLGKPCFKGIATVLSAASYICGPWAGTCDGKGACVSATTQPDGAPCGAADDSCAAAHVCKAGLCLPVDPKAEFSDCTYGCGKGVCRAGACNAAWYGIYNMPAPMPCADGDPCTDDFCGGGALPYWPLPPSWAPPGKCGHVDKITCIDGKPPVQYYPCQDSNCGKDGCGYQKTCYFDFGDKVGYCKTKYYLSTFDEENQWRCDDKSPCTLDGCDSGICVHKPANNGNSCGPFKQCQGGKCVPWN